MSNKDLQLMLDSRPDSCSAPSALFSPTSLTDHTPESMSVTLVTDIESDRCPGALISHLSVKTLLRDLHHGKC